MSMIVVIPDTEKVIDEDEDQLEAVIEINTMTKSLINKVSSVGLVLDVKKMTPRTNSS